MTSQETSQRLTVQEAAEALGTSVDAVRMRVRRGSLVSEKDPDGRVHVWVGGDESETRPRPNGEAEALLEAKDETISLLCDQLREEREARRRADTIIASLTQATSNLTDRLRELEAPTGQEGREEAPGSPESPVRTDTPTEASGGPETVSETSEGRRGFWARLFGG